MLYQGKGSLLQLSSDTGYPGLPINKTSNNQYPPQVSLYVPNQVPMHYNAPFSYVPAAKTGAKNCDFESYKIS